MNGLVPHVEKKLEVFGRISLIIIKNSILDFMKEKTY